MGGSGQHSFICAFLHSFILSYTHQTGNLLEATENTGMIKWSLPSQSSGQVEVGDRCSTIHRLHCREQPSSKERTGGLEVREAWTRTLIVWMDRLDRCEVFLVVCQND